MRIDELVWDDDTIEHIVRHGVNPQEIEDIFCNTYACIRAKYGRYAVYGRTSGGRYIRVIVEHLCRCTYRLRTAWDMNKNEKQKYRKIIG